MTLLERIEKKIFFRIVRAVTFLVAFIALIITIVGLYVSFNASMETKQSAITISREEIDGVLKPESTLASNTESSNEAEHIDPKQKILEELAKSFAKKALVAMDVKLGSEYYSETLKEKSDEILNIIHNSGYEYEAQLNVLKQLNELSNSFKKEKFFDQTNAFLALFKAKYKHDQDLTAQKNIANEASKIIAYSTVGAGIVIFALFVMILVLLRIEKNTRPNNENDQYDGTDKKLLLGILSVGVLLAALISWGVKQQSSENDSYDPVSELRPNFAKSEAAPAPETPVEEIAPAVDAAAPEDYAEVAPAAEAAAPSEEAPAAY